jgi:hypothetical protein
VNCPMTFCQWARRIGVVVFIGLAAVEGLVAAHCSNGHQMLPHMIAALVFLLVAVIAFLLDLWVESQS